MNTIGKVFLIAFIILAFACNDARHIEASILENSKTFFKIEKKFKKLKLADNIYRIVCINDEYTLFFNKELNNGKSMIAGELSKVLSLVRGHSGDTLYVKEVLNFMKKQRLYCIDGSNDVVEFYMNDCCPHTRVVFDRNGYDYLKTEYKLEVDSLIKRKSISAVPSVYKINDSIFAFKVFEDL